MAQMFDSTDPRADDDEETLLAKRLQQLGGTPVAGDDKESLTAKIIEATP